MKQLVYLILISFVVSCSSKQNSVPGKDTDELTKVAESISDSIVIVTYFSKDENPEKLAGKLWKEKIALIGEKDSSITYYLFVFNDLKNMPDIVSNQQALWNAHFMNYKSCVLDNGFGFPRFCYGIRYDVGRVGDWANFRYVKPDGSLAEHQ